MRVSACACVYARVSTCVCVLSRQVCVYAYTVYVYSIQYDARGSMISFMGCSFSRFLLSEVALGKFPLPPVGHAVACVRIRNSTSPMQSLLFWLRQPGQTGVDMLVKSGKIHVVAACCFSLHHRCCRIELYSRVETEGLTS